MKNLQEIKKRLRKIEEVVRQMGETLILLINKVQKIVENAENLKNSKKRRYF
jgi:DNA repair ATPase RecN